MRNKRTFLRVFLATVFIFNCLSLVSCSSKAENKEIREYLGDYSYDSSLSAFVYEQVDGEDEGFYGIQYRQVTDIDGLLKQDKIPVCLFFYSSVASSTLGIIPGVEDLAQTLDGRVLFVAVDAVQEVTLSSDYEVEAYPEFVLVRNGEMASSFRSSMYDYWGIDDVANWISANGYTPDYSLLDN